MLLFGLLTNYLVKEIVNKDENCPISMLAYFFRQREHDNSYLELIYNLRILDLHYNRSVLYFIFFIAKGMAICVVE